MGEKAFDSDIPPEAFILARERTAQVLRAGDVLNWNLRDLLGLAYLLGVKDCHDTIDLSDEAWEELKRRHERKRRTPPARTAARTPGEEDANHENLLAHSDHDDQPQDTRR